MKSFEFMYGNDWYKYEGGYIKKKYGCDFYDYFCPVLIETSNKLEGLSADQLHSIMAAILHGYYYGVGEGKKDKIREVKRVLNLD